MLSAIVGQLGRKLLLVALTGVMAVSGTIVVIAPIYEIFMVGRALIGIVIGGFWSVSVAIAMRLVPGMPSETMFSRAGGAGSSALAARPRPSPRVARAWSDGPGNRERGSPKTRNLHRSRRCPAFFDGRPVHRLIGEFFGLDGRGRGGRPVPADGSSTMSPEEGGRELRLHVFQLRFFDGADQCVAYAVQHDIAAPEMRWAAGSQYPGIAHQEPS
ncbi:hypothetical protein [Rhizobium leguminosarum]|uniref:hypothetical protein n=1 Tax=Rhizobium leguminosarum TaxID=384 RepID=UPI003D7C2F58